MNCGHGAVRKNKSIKHFLYKMIQNSTKLTEINITNTNIWLINICAFNIYYSQYKYFFGFFSFQDQMALANRHHYNNTYNKYNRY